jgi:hypothetical protein
MKSPVAVIIYNRPAFAQRLFHILEGIKPERLFIIADGPKADDPEDARRCRDVRDVFKTIPWNCRVESHFSDINLGCGKRPASGIDWVFEQVDRAIILEDDCIPNRSFFRFCDELLDRYAEDERIMQINGNNFQFGARRTEISYYFSNLSICWGWATWRRAWQYHDMGLAAWPSLRGTSWLDDLVEYPAASAYWSNQFDKAFQSGGDIDFWDYQWSFAIWSQNGLTIMPKETLVTNIGCGSQATHTKNPNMKIANLKTIDIEFPLCHPELMVRHREADRFFIENIVVPRTRQPKKKQKYHRIRKYASALRRKLSQTIG